MKSFESLYAILAVYIPLSVLAAFILPGSPLLETYTGPLPQLLWFMQGFFSAICASVYFVIVKKIKADHAAANIRGAVLVLITAYLLGSIFNNEDQIGLRFSPSLYNIPSAISAFIIWFLVLAVKRIFSEQELFESHMRNYSGEKLRQIFLEDSSLLGEASKGIKKVSANYIGFFLPSLVLMSVCMIKGIYINPLSAILFVFIFLTGICIIVFLLFLRREYAYAAEGLKLQNRLKVIMAGIIIMFAALSAGILFSSDQSLLPPSLLAGLLRFLRNLLRGLFRNAGRSGEMIYQMPVFENTGIPFDFLEKRDNGGLFPFWDWFRYAAVTAAAFLFIWFMISPLLRRSIMFKRFSSLPVRILYFFRGWFKAFSDGIFYFIKSLFEGAAGRKIRGETGEAIKRLEESLLAAYSRAKQRELKKSITLFARLIYWGEKTLFIKWKPSYAPIEYCALLADAVSKCIEADEKENIKGEKIMRAGELFEKALYSYNTLSGAERDEFRTLIAVIESQRSS